MFSSGSRVFSALSRTSLRIFSTLGIFYANDGPNTVDGHVIARRHRVNAAPEIPQPPPLPFQDSFKVSGSTDLQGLSAEPTTHTSTGSQSIPTITSFLYERTTIAPNVSSKKIRQELSLEDSEEDHLIIGRLSASNSTSGMDAYVTSPATTSGFREKDKGSKLHDNFLSRELDQKLNDTILPEEVGGLYQSELVRVAPAKNLAPERAKITEYALPVVRPEPAKACVHGRMDFRKVKRLSEGSRETSPRSYFAGRAAAAKWKPFVMNCDEEEDSKGPLCKAWAVVGLCSTHKPTMFLFCRKTCLCVGPY
ncbi:unnamed protein product [Caenorhabditis auriculariae]|uniref:ShKT domain-containing protein n=1 Tax=Caenorhabditis auriculariae TaxID=2777116 RepID=A0A8S1HP69_9PELO|nr:unnamed protein product [Caenorhabditis auriculariae]